MAVTVTHENPSLAQAPANIRMKLTKLAESAKAERQKRGLTETEIDAVFAKRPKQRMQGKWTAKARSATEFLN
jgi:hypothetical protein